MQEIGYVATIGMFDGVHRGHQFVLQHVADEARQRGLQSMAITFDKSGPQTLTPLDQKRLLLTKTGVDHIEVLTFNEALKQMTAREFMEQELRDRLNVKVLLTGYDNRFGHNRTEGFDDYVRYGKELGIEVISLPPAPPLQRHTLTFRSEKERGDIVSSSLIRKLIADGDIHKANELLGNPYTILGRVEHGEHIGTKLGYPTANLVLVDKCQLRCLCGKDQAGKQRGVEARHDEYRHAPHLRRTAPDPGGQRVQTEREPLRTTAAGSIHRTTTW